MTRRLRLGAVIDTIIVVVVLLIVLLPLIAWMSSLFLRDDLAGRPATRLIVVPESAEIMLDRPQVTDAGLVQLERD